MVQAACGWLAILSFVSLEKLQLKTIVSNWLNFYIAVSISVVTIVVEVLLVCSICGVKVPPELMPTPSP